jgi:hypothetical protein
MITYCDGDWTTSASCPVTESVVSVGDTSVYIAGLNFVLYLP